MKHSTLSAIVSLSLLVPALASAHEHRTFTINGSQYAIVIGSVNEPVTVDDKSGVEITVNKLTPAAGADVPQETPVTGLETTLKAEVSAGDKKQMFDLKPKYGAPGSYAAMFFPTVQTTYSYRLTGTIDAAPFDVTFTCNPAGHPATPEDTTAVTLTDKVTQIQKSGAFGCPSARTDISFPEKQMGSVELQEKIEELESDAENAKNFGTLGMVFGIIGMSTGLACSAKRQSVG